MADAPDYSELSIEQLNEFIERDPTDLAAYEWRADYYIDNDQFAAAQEDCLYCYHEGLRNIHLLSMLIQCAGHENDKETVSRYWKELELLDLVSAEDYFLKAYYSNEVGLNLSQARKTIALGLKKYPRAANLYFLRGQLNKVNNYIKRAESDFIKTIELDASKAYYFYHLADVEQSLQKYNEAINNLSTALHLNKDNAVYFHTRSRAYNRAGSPEDALNDLENACSLDPENMDYLYELAVQYINSKLIKKAKTALERMNRQNPKAIFYNISSFSKELETEIISDFDRLCEIAIDILKSTLDSNRTDPDYLDSLSALLAYSGKMDQAMALVEQAIKLDPNNLDYQIDYAMYLLFDGKYKECYTMLAILERAKEQGAAESNDSNFQKLLHGKLGTTHSRLNKESGETTAESLWYKANCLHYFGDEYGAKDCLIQFTQMNSDDPDRFFIAVLKLIDLHEFENAKNILEKYADENPASPLCHALLAECSLRTMNYGTALEHLRQSVKHKLDYPDLGYSMIKACISEINAMQRNMFSLSQQQDVGLIFDTSDLSSIQLSQAKKHISSLKKELERNPTNIELLIELGNDELRLLNLDDAMQTLNRAVSLAPMNSYLYFAKAMLKYITKQVHPKLSISEAFKKTRDKFSSHSLLTKYFSTNYVSGTQIKTIDCAGMESIIHCLNYAIRYNDLNINLYKTRGLLLFCESNFKEAYKDLAKFAKADGSDQWVNLILASICYRQKKYRRAIEYLYQFDDEKFSSFICLLMGKCYYYLEEYANSIQHFKHALEISTDNSEIYFLRGSAFFQLGKYNLALNDFQRSLAMENSKAETYLFIISCLLKLDQIDQAQVVAENAVRLYPEKPLFYMFRSNVHWAAGNYAQGIEDLSVFIDKKGHNELIGNYIPELGRDQLSASHDLFTALKMNIDYRPVFADDIILHFKNFINDLCIIIPRTSNHWFMAWIKTLLSPSRKKRTLPEYLDDLADGLDQFCMDRLCLDQKLSSITLSPQLQRLLVQYPWFDDKNIHNREYLSIASKAMLLQEISVFYSIENMHSFTSDFYNFRYYDMGGRYRQAKIKNTQLVNQTILLFMQNQINVSLQGKYAEVIEKQENEKWNARMEERNQLLANLSHSIKNNLSNVIDPLKLAESDLASTSPQVQNALRAACRISDIVSAMNYSVKGSIDDFIYDVLNSEGARSLDELILDACTTSTNNLFDGRNFSPFTKLYFPSKEGYLSSKKLWQEFNDAPDWPNYTRFINDKMSTLEVHIDDKLRGVRLGDSKKSYTKLLLLFQEIILNALKYSAPVDQENRFLELTFTSQDNKIQFAIKNRFRTDFAIKSSGLGRSVIENFARLLNTVPNVIVDGDIYSLEMVFKNLWLEVEK